MGMDTSVGATGTHHLDGASQQCGQSFLKNLLDRYSIGLYLPTMIGGSVKTKINKIEKDAAKKLNLVLEEISDEIEENDKIVRRKELNTKPMDEEEAMLQMEMLGHDFFIYKDRDTKRICILYKRKDGNYGLIETK